MNNETKKKDNNMLYIAIFTTIIIAVIVIVLLIQSGQGDGKDAASPKATPAPVAVVATEGSQNESIKQKIKSFRSVKFGKSHKAVNKFENKNADTLQGNYAVAQDGTAAYLTYKFNTEKSPEFFGAKVVTTDNNALLQYVFDKKGKMYEIRLQYGALSRDVYDSIVSNITQTYGNATFSREYSHGAVEHWWKTKNATLTAYYQETGVSVYFRKNK